MTTVELTVTAPEHKDLYWFDNTKLVALNTCPQWGIVRNVHNRTILSTSRAMALEAGSAAHVAYATLRYCDIFLHGVEFYGAEFMNIASQHIIDDMMREFGGDAEYVSEVVEVVHQQTMEHHERLEAIAGLALEKSGFYDDPGDKKRTFGNIQDALFLYIDRYPWGKHLPVVKKMADGSWFVGVELKFDTTVWIDGVPSYRFVGVADGIHYADKTMQRIDVHDNKTTSRVTDAWVQAFHMSHQFTGYCLAVAAYMDQPVDRCRLFGMQIPAAKSNPYSSIVNEGFLRRPIQFAEWADWFLDTVEVYERWKDDPLNVPKYTHSCGRYFRVCSMVPFCSSPMDEREDIFNEMVIQEWNPLEDGDGG